MVTFKAGDEVEVTERLYMDQFLSLTPGTLGKVQKVVNGNLLEVHIYKFGVITGYPSYFKVVKEAVLSQSEPEPTQPSEADALRAEVDRYRELYIEVSGTLAIVASWLRFRETSDLSAQQIYDMIAEQQGMPPAVIKQAQP